MIFAVKNQAHVVAFVKVIILPCHVCLVYLFVIVWEMGIIGCAYSSVISETLAFFMLLISASCLEGVRDVLYFPTFETFRNLKEYIALYAPAIAINFALCLNWEIYMFMAGRMHSSNILASQVTIAAFGCLLFEIP